MIKNAKENFEVTNIKEEKIFKNNFTFRNREKDLKKNENYEKKEKRHNSDGSNLINKYTKKQRTSSQPDHNLNHISENLTHDKIYLTEKNPNEGNNIQRIKNFKSQNFSNDFTLVQMINSKKNEKNISFFIKNKYRPLLENYLFI